MQGIEYLQYGSYACYILAIILAVVAIIIFFAMHIKDAILELSGKAKKTVTARMAGDYQNTGTLRNADPNTSGSLKKEEEINQGLMLTDGLKKGAGVSGQIRKVSKQPKQRNTGSGGGFSIIKEQMVIHTNEQI